MTGVLPVVVDVAVVATFVLSALLAFRQRGNPGAVPFTVLAVFLAGMTAGVTIARTEVISGSWTPYALFVPFVFASLAWVALAFEYTGRGPVVTRRRGVGLAAFGLAVVVVTVIGSEVSERFQPVWLVLVNAVQLGLVTAVGYGALLVARSAIDYDDLSRSGSLVLTTAGGGIVVVTIIQVLAPSVPYEAVLDIVQGVHAVIAVLLLLTQVRYRVFETGPSAGHLARETLLDEMSAAVAIAGRQGQLLDFDRTSERMFDLEQPDTLGKPVADAFGFEPTSTGSRPVTLETSEGRRQFEVDRSELTSRDDELVGRAYLLRDVTERQTHEQRLDVLNRVLRHNLRNDLDAIRGFAEALEHGDVDDPAALATQIRATASDLADLGNTLARADQLLEGDAPARDEVEVGELVRRLADAVGENYPDATVTVSTPAESVAVRTDRRVLETALEETVENAVEHNDAETPRVDLTVAVDASQVVIEVRDNGPGIPELEQSVLVEGEETPLRHGSGIGLWLVYWGVTRLGGTLEFRENDPRGSIVSLRIPNR